MNKDKKKKNDIELPKIPLDKNGNPKDPLDDVKYQNINTNPGFKDPLDDVR